MTRMLVVASPTLSPLSTGGPLPTDGQPDWWRCSRCDRRQGQGDNPASHDDLYEPCPSGDGHDPLPDGPFPFTVAVWQEAARCPRHDMPDCSPLLNGCSFRPFGAVVATVEVTDKGHDATSVDHYCIATDGETSVAGWHIPTSAVSRLDVPIPMDRPPADRDDERAARTHYWSLHGGQEATGLLTAPASWWWADLEIPTAVDGG